MQQAETIATRGTTREEAAQWHKDQEVMIQREKHKLHTDDTCDCPNEEVDSWANGERVGGRIGPRCLPAVVRQLSFKTI